MVMNPKEIALQLTLKAIDNNAVYFKKPNGETAEDISAFNAKQFVDFYNSVYSLILTETEFTAQTF